METNRISNILFHQENIIQSIHQLFDALDAVSVQGYDEQRRVIYWNRGCELLYGYTKDEALGKKLEDLIIPEAMSELVIKAHSQWINKGIKIPACEITLCDKDGNDVNVFSNHVMLVNQNNLKQMYCIDVDLSPVLAAQNQAKFKQHMLEALLEATPDLFFLMSEDGTIIDFHASDQKELYVSPKKFIGKAMIEVLPEGVGRKFQDHIKKALTQGTIISFEYELNMPNGVRYFEARIRHLPSYQQLIIIVRDITEQHQADEIIRQHAFFDTLTLLPNRFLALDRLSQMINEAERNDEKTAVLFLDLDDFQKVNDSLGHEVGDKLLIEAGQRLTQSVRKEDTVGRLGGDEFIVLLLTNPHKMRINDRPS